MFAARTPASCGESTVGLAGPVLGTIGCLVPLALWLSTGSDFWQACAFMKLREPRPDQWG